MKKIQQIVLAVTSAAMVAILSACGLADTFKGTPPTKAEDAKFLQLVEDKDVTSDLTKKDLLKIGHDIDWNLPREVGYSEKELLDQIRDKSKTVSAEEAKLIMSAAKTAYGLEEF